MALLSLLSLLNAAATSKKLPQGENPMKGDGASLSIIFSFVLLLGKRNISERVSHVPIKWPRKRFLEIMMSVAVACMQLLDVISRHRLSNGQKLDSRMCSIGYTRARIYTRHG